MGWREYDPVGNWTVPLVATAAGVVLALLVGTAVLSLVPGNSCACSPPPPTEHVDESFRLERTNGTTNLTVERAPSVTADEVYVRVGDVTRTWAERSAASDGNETLTAGDTVVLANATAGELVRVTYGDLPEKIWEESVHLTTTPAESPK